MPSEREKKRLGISQEKHVSVVGRRDTSLRIRAVQQKEESVLSVKNKDILLLVAKEIVLRWKVVKTANRKELPMAKKEEEDQVRGYSKEDEHVSCKERNPAICICCNGGSTQGAVYGVDFK